MPPDPTNENVIPAAVRRLSQRADDFARAAGAANVPPPVDAAPAEPTAGAPAPAAEAPAVIAPAHAPAAASPPALAQAPPAEDYLQKYRTLQGKYDAEVPSLRNQVISLERLISAMQTAPAAPASVPQSAPATTTVVPPEDVETFGEDLIAACRRWARAEVEPVLAELRHTVAELKTQTGHVAQEQTKLVTKSGRETCMARLDADPDIGRTWRQINEDPAFYNGWLLQPDPFSGQQRLKLLRTAFDVGDSARSAAFFRAFVAEHTASQPPAAAPTQTPTQRAGGPTLEDLAAPGRTTGPASIGAPGAKRVWTQRDITAFYRDVQRGTFEGRAAEKLQLEQDLFAAVTDGRVQ